jgi:adenylate cyclase
VGIRSLVKPKLLAAHTAQLEGYNLEYCAGADSGEAWAVRGGARNNNDLVWVGRAPNLAAKLSALREKWPPLITGTMFDSLSNAVKYRGNLERLMWEKFNWNARGKMPIYGST